MKDRRATPLIIAGQFVSGGYSIALNYLKVVCRPLLAMRLLLLSVIGLNLFDICLNMFEN